MEIKQPKMYQVPMKMEKSASFHDYGGMKSATVFLGIEPLLQRAASTGDAQLLLTLLQVPPQNKSIMECYATSWPLWRESRNL